MARGDGGGDDPGCNVTEFYGIVRASYSKEDIRAFIERTDLAVRVAKIRGLIPWDYDGERDLHALQDDWAWPEPPQWGEAA